MTQPALTHAALGWGGLQEPNLYSHPLPSALTQTWVLQAGGLVASPVES